MESICSLGLPCFSWCLLLANGHWIIFSIWTTQALCRPVFFQLVIFSVIILNCKIIAEPTFEQNKNWKVIFKTNLGILSTWSIFQDVFFFSQLSLAFLSKKACNSWMECICNFFCLWTGGTFKIHTSADIPLVWED